MYSRLDGRQVKRGCWLRFYLSRAVRTPHRVLCVRAHTFFKQRQPLAANKWSGKHRIAYTAGQTLQDNSFFPLQLSSVSLDLIQLTKVKLVQGTRAIATTNDTAQHSSYRPCARSPPWPQVKPVAKGNSLVTFAERASRLANSLWWFKSRG